MNFLLLTVVWEKYKYKFLKNCGNCLLYSLKVLLFLGGLELGMFCFVKKINNFFRVLVISKHRNERQLEGCSLLRIVFSNFK